MPPDDRRCSATRCTACWRRTRASVCPAGASPGGGQQPQDPEWWVGRMSAFREEAVHDGEPVEPEEEALAGVVERADGRFSARRLAGGVAGRAQGDERRVAGRAAVAGSRGERVAAL